MANYNSNLKAWGSTGVEYPSGYNYDYLVQPVDAYDNFVMHNVITDLFALIALTNARLESTKGSARPGSPEVGELFYDTDTDTIEVYTSGGWEAFSFDSLFSSHVADTANPHTVTAAQAGAIPDAAGSVDESHLSFDVATQAELDAHEGATNPHGTTPASIGALSLSGGTMTGNIDMAQYEVCEMVWENRADDPVSPVPGQAWYRTDTNQYRGYNGSAVVTFTVS